ncbi:MAG: pyridoxal 5'-phosphate synthase glutaminase subunit PdxT [Lachnospira sp.]
MKIGVLAVQGAFIEHERIIKALGADCVEIRKKADLEGIDGIILPGGESTVQGKLLRKLDMLDTLKKMIADGLPTLATCAGFILLSQKIENDETVHIGTMPVTIRRNAYGRQLSSFTTDSSLLGLDNVPMVFIRAPFVENVNDGVEVLSEIDGHIVAAKYKNQIGLSFHPELTTDYRIHELFIDMVNQN